MPYISSVFSYNKLIICIFCLIISTNTIQAQEAKIDVVHYSIQLDLSDLSSREIYGNTDIRFISLSDSIDQVSLMLQSLQIDSILDNSGQQLNFSHLSPDLNINLSKKLSKTDTQIIHIYYQGTPDRDPKWGGFYFSGTDDGYAFNMGVGFDDNPHNYGRVWFPCIDNFTDKASYDFTIATSNNHMAVCGGLLQDTIHRENKIYWHWSLPQEIPTYLASVAVGNYAFVKSTFEGLNGNYSILNACYPADTQKLKKSFANLDTCTRIFEAYYGGYKFDRIGFVTVPFNSGAMEHATNIAYPKYAINGNLKYEYLMAHEFSHHWWGDQVTCATAADMWLNEGWASYSEYLFSEKLYGRETYADKIQENHKYVLQYAHVNDKDVYPLSPVPHEVTYGTHVYDKGADVIHSLRSYLGDSLFFSGIKKFLAVMQFQNISSIDLRDSLSAYTGIDLTNFFDTWVFSKGFPHFYIQSVDMSQTPEIKLIIKNDPRHNDQSYTGTPLDIYFYANGQKPVIKRIVLNQNEQEFIFDVPEFIPEIILIDPQRNISDARTLDLLTISKPGSYNLSNALFDVQVTSLKDSFMIAVEQHWKGPQTWPHVTNGIRFSNDRYWTVQISDTSRAVMAGLFKYDGRNYGSPDGSNYLDYTMHITHEDSLVLLYRAHPEQAWDICKSYVLSTGGSKKNQIGQVKIEPLLPGDYCLGYRDATAGISKSKDINGVKIYPNPARNEFYIKFRNNTIWDQVIILDTNGKQVYFSKNISTRKMKIPTHNWATGTYIIQLSNKMQETFNQYIIITK